MLSNKNIPLRSLSNIKSLKYWGSFLIVLWLVFLPTSWYFAQKTTYIREKSHQLYQKVLYPLSIHNQIIQTSLLRSLDDFQNLHYKKSESEDLQITLTKIQKDWLNTILPHLDSLDKITQQSKNENLIETNHSASRKIRQLYRNIQNAFKILKENQPIILSSENKKNAILYFPNYANIFQNALKPNFENAIQDLEELTEKLNIFRNTQDFEAQKKHQFWLWFGLLLAILTALFSGLLGYYLYYKYQQDTQQIENYTQTILQGNIPKQIQVFWVETQKTAKNLNQFSKELKEVKDFTEQVKKGKFDHNFVIFNEQGTLGKAFKDMQKGLIDIFAENNRRDWANEGLAKFGQIIAQYSDNLEALADKTIKELVIYLQINQGGFFMVEEQEQTTKLILKAAYAYDKKKFLEKEINKGQGLLGQVWQEGEVVYLKEIPDNYIQITSGLGEATPKVLLIVPFRNNQQILGLFELASFQEIPTYQIEFVTKVADSIGQIIANIYNKSF
jgi:hypothetical protein